MKRMKLMKRKTTTPGKKHLIMMVPIRQIVTKKIRPEKGLVQTLKDYGQLQNVILTRTSGLGKYKVIAGRRRIQALIKLGKDEVQAMIIKNDPKGEAMISLIENMHRSDNPGSEATMLKRLMDGGITQEKLAAMLQVSQAQISKRIRLLSLTSKLFERLNRGELKPSIARELAKLPKKEQAPFENRDSITLEDLARAEIIHAPGAGDAREAPTVSDQKNKVPGGRTQIPRDPLNIEKIMLAQARKMPMRPGQIGLSNWIRNFFAAFKKGEYDIVIKPRKKTKLQKKLQPIVGKPTITKPRIPAGPAKKKARTPAKDKKHKPLKGEIRCPICHRPYPLDHMQKKHGWVWSKKDQKYEPPGGSVSSES